MFSSFLSRPSSLLGFVSLCVLLLSELQHAAAKSSTGDSVLVLVEPNHRDKYSIFLAGLEAQGYKLTYRGAREEHPLLIEYDVPAFEHIILLSTDTKVFAKDLTPQNLVTIAEKGTNIIFTLSQKQNFISSLASEFSLVVPPPATPLISYFPERDEPSSIIPIPIEPKPLLKAGTNPVWFSGVPFALSPNPLLFSILNAPAESFAADSDAGADALADNAERGGEGLWAGTSLSVVAGFQLSGGSNTRIAWVGGPEIFSDDFAKKSFNGKQSGNIQFTRDLAAWTFQESLVLRVDGVEHYNLNGTTKEQYTTNEEIVFKAHLSSYNAAKGVWEPTSSLADLQLEFTMLDPFVRTSLPAVKGQPGVYQTQFRAPDRHGVFKFVVDYRRKGYTHLLSSTTVSVVPPRHDGYPRFLSAAWPYYVGAISTSLGFFLFTGLWLGGEFTRESSKRKKAE